MYSNTAKWLSRVYTIQISQFGHPNPYILIHVPHCDYDLRGRNFLSWGVQRGVWHFYETANVCIAITAYVTVVVYVY